MAKYNKIEWMNPELVNLNRHKGAGSLDVCTGGSTAGPCENGGVPGAIKVIVCAAGETNKFDCISGGSTGNVIDAN